ncbi:MAG: hypothetical protein RLZZ330_1016 [Actinomycetota bacterium]|jgi:electron transfer flavoprotein beta subunit
MKIAVLVKQVPSEQSVLSLDPNSMRLTRMGLDFVANSADLAAVECALVVSDKAEIETFVVSMGPVGVADSTKKALAMGIGSAVHITDEKLAGSDIWMTAKTLASAIAKRDADFVFTGVEAADTRSGVVPAMIAGILDWNFVAAESELEIDQLINLKQKTVVAISPQMNSPRLPNFKGIAAAKTKPVVAWDLSELGIDNLAPKVRVVSYTEKVAKSAAEKVSGTNAELAKMILGKVQEWSTVSDAETEVISSSSSVKVFDNTQKFDAAIYAGKNGLGIITDVTKQINENKFVKENFDGKVEAVVEAVSDCVVTTAAANAGAGISVCVGGGVSEIQNLDNLVGKLDAFKVGTAAALDKGFITVDQLVGESGTTIKPNIYLGFGVSGAHHHLVGVKSARHLIAVNKDPEAEIFQRADLAIVADADEILAELVKELSN